jgi:lysophospholipase L1-like esterase
LRLTEVFGSAAVGTIEGYRSDGILQENDSSGVICHCIGINGATSENFMDDKYMTEIQQLHPDLIIISLGTNEGFGSYDSDNHYSMMESLFSMLRNSCPNVPILYTTPPGAFKTIYGRRYRRHRRVYRKVIRVEENRNIERATATIVRFAADHQVACWDLFNIAGGERYACRNWLSGNYFQRDRVHFVSDGYALQGDLLYEAIMNEYNKK